MKYPPCKPLLPDAQALVPYLKQIDNNRYYSNFGPLLAVLHTRFADLIGVDAAHVMTASSGMSGLELTIAALDLPHGSTVVLPSWTFCATAHAVLNAGLIPHFVDVDRQSWALTPQMAEDALKRIENVSLVMPVAPFGLALPVQEWEAFSDKYGVAVIIDGAALCPEDITPSEIVPIMVSLHATKIINAGEGGLMVWQNADKIQEIKNRSGFGLFDERGISVNATNAKISEYHAAVALASIDAHAQTRDDYMRIAQRYRDNLNGSGIKLLQGYGTARYNSFCLIEFDDLNIDHLHNHGISTRPWWRKGCHREPLFGKYTHDELQVTEYLADHSIGLPCYRDLTDDDIDFICEKLTEAAR